MKESKEIDSISKAKKFIEDFIKISEGLDRYDDKPGSKIDLDFTCAIMARFYDQETKQLREELQEYKDKYDVVFINDPGQVEYVKSLNDRIKELEEGIESFIILKTMTEDGAPISILKSLLTKDTKNK